MKNLLSTIVSEFGKAFAQQLVKPTEQVQVINVQVVEKETPAVSTTQPVVDDQFTHEDYEKLNPYLKYGETYEEVLNGDYLYLNGFSKIKDISPLKNLTNLKGLGLINRNKVSDLTLFKDFVNLERLWVHYNNISDISPLECLINLKILWLECNKITDIKPLKNLINLKVLQLWTNKVSDITPLENLADLNTLDLYDNRISDLTPLQNLINLEYLDLSKNHITNITPLKNLVNLKRINLHHNNITDITPLKGLVNLKNLWVHGNKIPQEQIDELQKCLPNCEIYRDLQT